MDEQLIKNANKDYELAEKKAINYYKLLYSELKDKSYIETLKKDIELWGKSHRKNKSFMSRVFNIKSKKDSPKDYDGYIKWLNKNGKLDNYLDRSISYIFLRDLGKDLSLDETKKNVRSIVEELKTYLTKSKGNDDKVSLDSLYRKAEKEGVELTLIWLINKLKRVESNIPDGIDSNQAMRKILKIIVGVVIHQVEELDDDMGAEERSEKINIAIRIGYSYGLTYPFIDDLLDAKILSNEEERVYSELIKETLITGIVPDLGCLEGRHIELIAYIHSELKEGFEYIKSYQSPSTVDSFLKLSYIFFRSQEVDREKELNNLDYANEEIYAPVILKAASSRLIVRAIINAPEDNYFESRTFFYGIYNQLADDFTDIFDDSKDNSFTAYSYYLKHYNKGLDIINPFELYWIVIFHLIHNIYESDSKTCEVILDRAINSLKRFKEKMGIEKYDEVMKIFLFDEAFNNLIQDMVNNAQDVDFFDKLLRDYIIDIFKAEKKAQKDFKDKIKMVSEDINKDLSVSTENIGGLISNEIVDAANYSIEGGGKRLRPIITYAMAVDGYGLKESSIKPLLKSLEYMHTASLILDDLPSQDNAKLRRNRKTLHLKYNVAVAELTSIFLTEQAIKEQTFLNDFNEKILIKLIRYSTEVVTNMTKGQAIDLDSKGKKVTLEQLKTMCFYKTSIAFEAAIIMAAILGEAKEEEIKALKEFASYAGLAFQIKDDILDVTGDSLLLGKTIGKDAENNNSTFVSILGYEEAEKELWRCYAKAIESLKNVPRNIDFLKQLVNYIVLREH